MNEPPVDRPRIASNTTTPRLPDFFIIGGQKCGSTALCHQVAAHPEVFFSRPKELYFFNRDDVPVVPYAYFERYDDWADFDWTHREEALLRKYSSHFEDAGSRLCGEGTPSYLPSRRAARRIRSSCPNAQLVVILRNPVDRAYSAYWHHLKMRRATETFENHLRYEAGGTLAFGHYREQLEDWIGLFGRDRIHVLLFEDFVRDKSAQVNEVFGFLGLAPLNPRTGVGERQNTAQVPRSPLLQRLLNRALHSYSAHYSTIEFDDVPQRSLSEMALSKTIRGIGRLNLVRGSYPPMDPKLRERLDTYYRRQNEGLAELVSRDLSAWGW